MKSEIEHMDPVAFRNALGQFSTGVTVVTCATEMGPMGITANSFSSLSLAPPLVLWAPAKASRRHIHFAQCEFFAIHVLAADQKELCEEFTRASFDFDAFAYRENPEGTPVFAKSLARFECRRHALYDGGDHSLIVGRVLRFYVQPGEPLVFAQGRYGGVSAKT